MWCSNQARMPDTHTTHTLTLTHTRTLAHTRTLTRTTTLMTCAVHHIASSYAWATGSHRGDIDRDSRHQLIAILAQPPYRCMGVVRVYEALTRHVKPGPRVQCAWCVEPCVPRPGGRKPHDRRVRQVEPPCPSLLALSAHCSLIRSQQPDKALAVYQTMLAGSRSCTPCLTH